MRYRLPWVLIAPLTMAATLMTVEPAAAKTLASPAPNDTICPSGGLASVGVGLPELPASLVGSLDQYAREAPAGASTLDWYDSGGRFGGGVPVRSVEQIMLAGLAKGLSQEQVAGFLNPGFLRGVSDPYGGGDVLAFIVKRGDPAFLSELAAYSGTVPSSIGGPMEAQSSLFQAFPLLNVVYEAQAGVPPLDAVGAATMTDLAEFGYQPAQQAIDRILAGGNHPQSGAQLSGSVADGVRPEVYDYIVANYVGPLSSDARSAVANRQAYLAWVDRIETWVAGGASMEQIPATATFTAPVNSPSAVWSTVPEPGSACPI